MNNLFIFSAQYLFLLSIIILGIYFIKQPRQTKMQMAIFSFMAMAITYLIGLAGGLSYFDPRPFVVGDFTPLIPHAPDNGFPSDHALLLSAIAMIGIYWNRKLGIALWIIAAVVGVARVYVGIHHPVDIIGSMVIAAIGVTVAHVASKYIPYEKFVSRK